MGAGEEGGAGRQGGGALQRKGTQEDEVWERVVVVTLLAVLRREREWRYTLAGHFLPIKRTIC